MARKQLKHQWHQYLPINFPTFPHINPTVSCWILPTFEFFLGGQAWDANFEKVYDLAWLVVQRNVASMCPGWAAPKAQKLRGFWMLQLLTVTVRERCVLYICIYIICIYNLIVSCHISLWVIIVSALAGDHCNPWPLHSNCRFGDGLPNLLHPSGWLGRRRFL